MARQRKKMLIVDGYNVLRSGYRYRAASEEDYTDDFFNKARDTLINDVVNFAGREYKAVIVFDGAKNQYSEGRPETVGGVQIIFSPAGQSADKVIEKLAHDARERMVEALVVTSDATIQDTVFGGGIDRMSADGFSHEVGEYYEGVRLDEHPEVARKNTIAERISPAALAKLKQIRDAR
ncbi:NYN domain-containing protein [Parvibacter caecicola]|uniref:NYN domain-containing protein n=1 Tax=Parvibacter caecicola TaxID=747645 RepID=UPI0023F00481|nr:NYN domain-containing protein [Parvibacter caecicola]